MISENATLQIIPADVEQLEAAAALLDAYRMFYGKESDIPEARHYLFSRMTCHDSIIFLAMDSAQPEEQQAVGFVQLYPSFSSLWLKSILILNDLFVVPSARHQKVATRLIEAAMDLARERGDHGLVLETARDNEPARHLYQGLGFQKDSEYDRYFYNL